MLHLNSTFLFVARSYSFLSNFQFTSKYALNRREIAILSLFSCNIHIFLYNPSIEIILQIIIIMTSYLLLIHPPISLAILFQYLSSFIFSLSHLSVIYTYYVLTQCSQSYSVFAFPLSATYFPLSVSLHLSKLCVYINYVYSTVPRCVRLLPVHVNAD